MCAIVGWASGSGQFRMDDALAALHHRGPDANGQLTEQLAGLSIGLGHCRLSIIDLSADANQPFRTVDDRHVMVYNGEVYNFGALRGELEEQGCRFRTRSDTEVILEGLALEGTRFLARLDGMFALAWLDRAEQRLILARDRLGIKPLYYQLEPEGFGLSFASEVRGLRALTGRSLRPDLALLPEFLLNGFLYEPETGIAGVRKLAPGQLLEVRLAQRTIRTRDFIDPAHDDSPTRDTAGPSFEALIDGPLRAAVADQRVADVPLGLFFSGGIDSSVLAAASGGGLEGLYLAHDDASGSAAGGDAPYVEAMATALKLPLRRVALQSERLEGDALLAHFSEVAAGVEEPISDYTFMASAAIAKAARAAGFTVMLSGMGGDELFAGYPRHHLAARADLIRGGLAPAIRLGLPLLRRIRRFDKRAARFRHFLAADSFGLAYTSLVGYLAPEAVCELLGDPQAIDPFRRRLDGLLAPVAKQGRLRQAMHLDRLGFLAHNLTVTDKSSMQHSVEVRVPLLGNRVLSFAEGLPPAALMRRGQSKRVLARWLAERVPPSLVYRPKTGFNPPLDERIRTLGRGRLQSLLTSGRISRVLQPAAVRRYVEEHFDGRANHTYVLWQLTFLALWLDQWDA